MYFFVKTFFDSLTYKSTLFEINFVYVFLSKIFRSLNYSLTTKLFEISKSESYKINIHFFNCYFYLFIF